MRGPSSRWEGQGGTPLLSQLCRAWLVMVHQAAKAGLDPRSPQCQAQMHLKVAETRRIPAPFIHQGFGPNSRVKTRVLVNMCWTVWDEGFVSEEPAGLGAKAGQASSHTSSAPHLPESRALTPHALARPSIPVSPPEVSFLSQIPAGSLTTASRVLTPSPWGAPSQGPPCLEPQGPEGKPLLPAKALSM